MKKLLLISLLFCSSLFGQVATNRIINTAVIYDVNSRLTVLGGTTSVSNLNSSGFGSFGSINAQVTHSLINSNSGNVTFNVRNAHPNGNSGFVLKNSAGTDMSAYYFQNNTSNLIIASASNRPIIIEDIGGVDRMIISPSVTSNIFSFVSGSLNTTNLMINDVRGLAFSETNEFGGVTNVLVFGQGVVTNRFQVP